MATSRDTRLNEGENFLEGKLLIAMPGMADERFAQTVIYICAHSAKGAMGIVINKPIPGLSFAELMKQLQIEAGPCGRRAADPLWRAGRNRPRLRAAQRRLRGERFDASGLGGHLAHGDARHPESHCRRTWTETRAVRARLCRLGRGPSRKRVPVQRLAPLPCRPDAGVRNRSAGQMEHRARRGSASGPRASSRTPAAPRPVARPSGPCRRR